MKYTEKIAQNDTALLKALYWNYINEQGPAGQNIKAGYEKLHQFLREFSWKEQNEIECAVNELYAMVEEEAFINGLQTGAKLILALIQ